MLISLILLDYGAVIASIEKVRQYRDLETASSGATNTVVHVCARGGCARDCGSCGRGSGVAHVADASD